MIWFRVTSDATSSMQTIVQSYSSSVTRASLQVILDLTNSVDVPLFSKFPGFPANCGPSCQPEEERRYIFIHHLLMKQSPQMKPKLLSVQNVAKIESSAAFPYYCDG
jgi:hypothetical protein